MGRTPDGISAEDWDRVHDLALEAVNKSGEGELAASESASLQLRQLLDELQRKYGPLPSLLATRADYVDDVAEQEYWLAAAYEQAVVLHDMKNLVWIASSLAAFHLETVPSVTKGAHWLTQLDRHLAVSPSQHDAEEACRLRAILDGMRSRITTGCS